MNKVEINLAAQSTYYKLKKSSSKDNGIFIEGGAFDFIKPFLFRNDNGRDAMNVIIYRSDCVEALGNIMCSLPLFSSNGGVPKEETSAVDVFNMLGPQIEKFFGDNDTALLTSLYFTDLQGRKYLWGTEGKKCHFELRKFFIANHTTVTFEADEDHKLVLRFKTHVVTQHLEQFAPQDLTEDVVEEMKAPLSEPLQIIFYGAPGTGKSHKIDNDSRIKDSNTIRITFHPDSDYSTFVGAYKPTMANVAINVLVDTNVQNATGINGHPGTEKKIVYKYVPQAFMKAYVAAWRDLANPHFLIIEEINRGNCAQIFGDLFQLLDRNSSGCSTYAIHADEDIAQFLRDDDKGFAGLSDAQKDAIRSFVLVKDSGTREQIGEAILNGTKLLLPPNLYIWATMNTSDQSLFPIDSAFKRRWNWEYIPIDYHVKNWQFEVAGKRFRWADFLLKINPLIYSLTQSADKQMGYFFAKADKKTDMALAENDLISEKVFLNKVLFYLWTDVMKDFEPSDKIFRDNVTGSMYQFSDFFSTTNGKLAEFVAKLGLPKATDGAVGKPDDFDSPVNEAAD